MSTETAKLEKPKTHDDDEEETKVEISAKIKAISLLPISTMNLDNSKKRFNELRKEGINYFTEEFGKEFDANGYSIYKFQYNYDDDMQGKMDFINRNLINGYKQEIQETIKPNNRYLFGTLNLIKTTEDKLKFEGVFIVRGQDIFEELFGGIYGYSTWTKLDNPSDNIYIAESFYGDTIGTSTVEFRTNIL